MSRDHTNIAPANDADSDPPAADGSSGSAGIKKLLAGLADEAKQFNESSGGSVTGAVADWLAGQYLAVLKKKLDGDTGGESEKQWHVLRAAVQDFALLRRGDHSATRLALEREELELLKTNLQAQKEKEFAEWLNRPDVREKYFPDKSRGISEETFDKIARELRIT